VRSKTSFQYRTWSLGLVAAAFYGTAMRALVTVIARAARTPSRRNLNSQLMWPLDLELHERRERPGMTNISDRAGSMGSGATGGLRVRYEFATVCSGPGDHCSVQCEGPVTVVT
jgi:hypothetical protein